jgi:Protein of unknown function (DUF4232)
VRTSIVFTALGLGVAVAAVATSAAATTTSSTATTTSSTATTARPPTCRTSDVAYYYGGSAEGVGARSFDITLAAKSGVRCRLTDQPEISVQAPDGSATPVQVQIGGRGGTLVLTPSAPLHTSVSWHVPDEPDNKAEVSSLTLGMPGGGTANRESFQYPGTTVLATSLGIRISAWTTGLGGSEGDGSYTG